MKNRGSALKIGLKNLVGNLPMTTPEKKRDSSSTPKKSLLDKHAPFPAELAEVDEFATAAPSRETITIALRRARRRFPHRAFRLAIGTTTVALIGLALFLPPFSTFERLADMDVIQNPYHFQKVDGGETDVVYEALTLQFDREETLRVRLNKIAGDDYRRNEIPDSRWNCPPASTLPPYLVPVGEVFSIETHGLAEKPVAIRLLIENAARLSQVDLYGFDPTRDRWHHLPARRTNREFIAESQPLPLCLLTAQTLPMTPLLGIGIHTEEMIDETVLNAQNRVYAGGLMPAHDGHLVGVLPANLSVNARYRLMVSVSNAQSDYVVDVGVIETILNNATLRQEHQIQLLNFAQQENIAGLTLDYRYLPDSTETKQNFNRFLVELARGLHGQGKILSVVLPLPVQNDDGIWQTGAYDWRRIGQITDEIILMLPPLDSVEDQDIKVALEWVVQETNRYQVLIGFSAAQENAERLTALVNYHQNYALAGLVVWDLFQSPEITALWRPLQLRLLSLP